MSYSDFRYHAPTDLAVTPTVLNRVLVIGSCLISSLPEFIEANSPGCKADYILFNNLSELPSQPPHPATGYDFQIIQIATRSVLQEHHYFRLEYEDISGYEALFVSVKQNLYRILDGALAYNKAHGMLTFVSNFLLPQQNAMGRLLPRYDLRNPVYFFEQLNFALHEEIGRHTNIHVLDIDMISASVGRKYVQDDAVWSFAHNAALSDADFNADQQRIEQITRMSERYDLRIYPFVQSMWCEIVSMYRTLHQIDLVKMVIIDLDDTLWRGVLAEQTEPSWELIEGWPLGFSEALLFLKRRGILLAILSKNDEDMIRTLWDRVFQGLLSIEDFAIVRINWRPKADNFIEILTSANLLPSSVVYIDDNPVERDAIRQNFPDVRLLGSDPYLLKRVLLWASETQVHYISAESARRTEMIQKGLQRDVTRQHLSRAQFLASLELETLHIEISNEYDSNFNRAFELINKTNQYNTTGKRWTFLEAQESFLNGATWHCFQVNDKFSNYGLVVVLVIEEGEITQFVMSCRIAGLDVEKGLLSLVRDKLRKDANQAISGSFIKTKSNGPMLMLLKSLGAELHENSNVWQIVNLRDETKV